MRMGVRPSARQLAARERHAAISRAAWRRAEAVRAVMLAPECAATECGARVAQRGHLMCRDHWLSLPLELRLVILRSQAAGHVRSYQDAVTAAVDLIDNGRVGL